MVSRCLARIAIDITHPQTPHRPSLPYLNDYSPAANIVSLTNKNDIVTQKDDRCTHKRASVRV